MLRPHDFPPGGAPRGDRCAPPNCVDGDPGDATPGENYEERDAPLTDVIVPARGDGPLEAQGSARGRLALPSLIRLPPRRLRWTPARCCYQTSCPATLARRCRDGRDGR